MRTYKLRPYQEDAVKAGIGFFKKKSKKNAVIVAPTGSGKSLIIANIAKKLDGKTIVFQPTKELLEQNYSKYCSYGEYAEIYSASAGRKKISKVTFATIGSVVNKPELFKEFQYCIVDECHLVSPQSGTMYQKFFNKLDLKVLGLTATPVRLKTYNFPDRHSKLNMLDRMRPKFFNEFIHVTQISELVGMGFFAHIEYISNPFNKSALQVNTTGAEYTDNSIKKALYENNTNNQITQLCRKIYKKGVVKHVLIFTVTVEDAEFISKNLDSCAVVSAKTKKKDREEILKDFKSGKIKTVANVGILTTGFDFPELDCIILARPTMSLALYYQMIGRAVRPHQNKEKAYIIDMVGVVSRFGKVENLTFGHDRRGLSGLFSNGVQLTNVDISGINVKTV